MYQCCHLMHRIFQCGCTVSKLKHQCINTICIVVILVTGIYKIIIIRHDLILNKRQHLISIVCKLSYWRIYFQTDILNVICCLTARICQFTNLISHYSKSLTNLAGTCCFNGCIQCKQVCLRRNLQNIICQYINLFNIFTLFKRTLKQCINFTCHLCRHLTAFLTTLLQCIRTVFNFLCEIRTIICLTGNMLHCFINTSCLVIQMVGMVCNLFHSGRKFFHYLRYQFDIAIRCIYTIKHLLNITLQLNGIGFDFHNNVAE